MARNITCELCSKPLGFIKDGVLSKGLKTICTTCFNKLPIPDKNNLKSDEFDNMFKNPNTKDLFGEIFGDKFSEFLGKSKK